MDDTAEPNDEMLSQEPDATAASVPDEIPGAAPGMDVAGADEVRAAEGDEPYQPVFVGEDEVVEAEPQPPAPEPLFAVDDYETTPEVAVPDEQPTAEVAAPDEPAAEPLSLEDMVSELGSDADATAVLAPVAGEPAEGEAEPEAADGTEAQPKGEGGEPTEPEGETAEEGAAEVSSWRDAAAAEAPVSGLVRERLSTRLPFWIYGGVWVVFVGVMTFLMWPLSHEPFIDATYYSYFVLGCAALLAVGPIMAVAVWGFSRVGASDSERQGLVRSLSIRTAGWMAVGAALMWIVLYVLDLHRIGVIGS
jgi:hypothetical protein